MNYKLKQTRVISFTQSYSQDKKVFLSTYKSSPEKHIRIIEVNNHDFIQEK